MTTGTYLPLIGGENLVSVLDGADAAMLQAQIVPGTPANGRAGNVKTSLLLALSGASPANLTTTNADLASLTIVAPPSAPVPALGAGGDYSLILPSLRASVLSDAFAPTGVLWPNGLTAFFAGCSPIANTSSLYLNLTAAAVPSTPYPYGTYTFSLQGLANTASILLPLILIEIDFGASASN
jgi:hypothetical protein